MLDSFFVKNFRLFADLEVKSFGRVNLLVGRNNSGKSALLEAIRLYASDGSAETMVDLVKSRRETWNGHPYALTLPPKSSIRHLFRGHRLPGFDEEGVKLGICGRTIAPMHIHTALYEREMSEDGALRRTRIEPTEALLNQPDPPDVDVALICEDGNRIRRLFWIEDPLDGSVLPSSSRVLDPASPRHPVQSVPPGNMTEARIASLWDLTSLTPWEPEVIRGLQLIDESINGVAFVDDSARGIQGDRIPLAKVRGELEPVPLKSMGDGMTRLFHIVVALVNARDGILLIDEFENGLHWSVQPAIWKTVFRLAEEMNVQVFASTHSRDCILGFEEAWQEHPSSGAFFRLRSDSNLGATITSIRLETLSNALETEVEVR